jgi:1,4-dihydroxy-2-naphthoate octaprenyltransferase
MSRRTSLATVGKSLNSIVLFALDMGLGTKTLAVLEHTGRRTGRIYSTPVGNGLVDDVLWIVAVRGNDADYVKNIGINPNIRIKLGDQWFDGRALVLPDDDALTRTRAIPNKFVAALIRALSINPLIVRVTLPTGASGAADGLVQQKGHRRSRAARYAALAKADIPYYSFGPIVAWSGVPNPFGWVAAPAAMMAVGAVVANFAAAAFDDIEGLGDGIDEITYHVDSDLRSRARKPLVTGELTIDEARRFAVACLTGSMGVNLLGFVISPFRRLELLPIGLAGLLLAVQYAYGLKLSYRPGGSEAALFGSMLLVTIGPGLLFGAAMPDLWIPAMLMSSGMTQSTMCGNGQDAVADAAAGRHTIATLLSPKQYGRLVAMLSVVDVLVVAWGAALGVLRPSAVLALLPAAPYKVQHARSACQGNWLQARRTGFDALRLVAIGLVASRLIGRRRRMSKNSANSC